MTDPFSLPLPGPLRARLIAAGVTDEAGMHAALEHDLELRAAFDAFLAEHEREIDGALGTALDEFLATKDSAELLALTQRAPFVLDASFVAIVEQLQREARDEGDSELDEGLQLRLDGLAQIRGQAQIALPQLLDAFTSTRSTGDMASLAQRAPAVLEAPFERAVEQLIDGCVAEGRDDEAGALRSRIETLRQIREQQQVAQESPLMRALVVFLNVHTAAEAEAVFAAAAVLDSDEAVETLAILFQGADAASQVRIDERGALLARLREG